MGKGSKGGAFSKKTGDPGKSAPQDTGFGVRKSSGSKKPKKTY